MNSILKKQITVPISLCDNRARMSVTGLLCQFMDMASEHGAAIGLGADVLAEHGLIWLVSRTRLTIRRLPYMLSPVTVSTWPEAPGKIRCHRYYTLSDGSGVLAEGKNEWAMLEVATGRPHRLSDAYPPELEHMEDTACDGPFARLDEDFSGCEELGRYAVRSTDIDTSDHMNNVAYVRAFFGALPSRLLNSLEPRELDVSYRAQCYEGEELSIRLREIPGGYEGGILKADGRTAAAVRLLCGATAGAPPLFPSARA